MALAVLALSCAKTDEPRMDGKTLLTISLPNQLIRTTMGPSEGGERHVYWSEGDCLSLNGTTSNPLSASEAGGSSAVFTFPGVLSTPYRVLYPASFYKNVTTITLPSAIQTIGESTFENCSGISEISLPATLRFLDEGAFSSCTALEGFTFDGTKAEWNSIRKPDTSGNAYTQTNKVIAWDEGMKSYTVECTDGELNVRK